MSHWLCWVNSSYACGLNREARFGKPHSVLAAAGREDKRVTCMEQSYVGLFSWRGVPQSKKKQKTIALKLQQLQASVTAILITRRTVIAQHEHHPSAATVPSFNGKQIPPGQHLLAQRQRWASPSHSNQYRRAGHFKGTETLHQSVSHKNWAESPKTARLENCTTLPTKILICTFNWMY